MSKLHGLHGDGLRRVTQVDVKSIVVLFLCSAISETAHEAPQEVEKFNFLRTDHTLMSTSLSFFSFSSLHLSSLSLPFLLLVFHVQIREACHLSQESREALV